MSGETDLDRLLRGMQPALQPDTYVFVTRPVGAAIPSGVTPRMVFREPEGVTLILTREEAEQARLQGVFPCRMITLTVHSSLEAVGFMAAVAGRLAQAGIGVNPVAGFHHDHLFVPDDRAEEAVRLLAELSTGG